MSADECQPAPGLQRSSDGPAGPVRLPLRDGGLPKPPHVLHLFFRAIPATYPAAITETRSLSRYNRAKMRTNSLRAVLLLAAFSIASAAAREDTVRLAAHLKAVRGEKLLLPAEYASIRKEYLDWIDVRVKAGDGTERMNRELGDAGLFTSWGDMVAEASKSHAGYLEKISAKPVRGAGDILALEAGIYEGTGCSLDVTAVLYQRDPLTRLAQIDAAPEEPKYAFRLSGLDAGWKDANGERLVASGWVASNCTSNWNGKRIRIDRVNGPSPRSVLAQSLIAKDRYKAEDVAARVQGHVVTFWYEGSISDDAMLHTASVARYRIAGDLAVREAPVALTRAGFIEEWLGMTDSDAARWGEPEAVASREALVAAVAESFFEWERIARCGGSPQVWEVAVRINASKKLYVFRIGGTRATDLRMLAITGNPAPSCVPEDIAKSLDSVGAELPW